MSKLSLLACSKWPGRSNLRQDRGALQPRFAIRRCPLGVNMHLKGSPFCRYHAPGGVPSGQSQLKIEFHSVVFFGDVCQLMKLSLLATLDPLVSVLHVHRLT